MKRFQLLLLWATAGINLPAREFREFLYPQSPPELKWLQIRTHNFTVIFNSENELYARRVAALLELHAKSVHDGLRTSIRPFPVLLHGRMIEANGFVTLAPRRSEFFAHPPPTGFSTSTEWLELLAIHEGRHIAQFNLLHRGVYQGAYWLLGEAGESAALFSSVPGWVWEGDAVTIETAASVAGRGRQPEHTLYFRALIAEGKDPGYSTSLMFTYDRLPVSPYVLGYLLNTQVIRDSGPEAWSRIFRRTSRIGYYPYATSRAMYLITGRNARATYEKMVKDLTTEFQTGVRSAPDPVLTEAYSSTERFYTEYLHPMPLHSGGVLNLKAGLSVNPQWVISTSDVRGRRRDEFISFAGNTSLAPPGFDGRRLLWQEQQPDIRWGMVTTNRIRLLDTQSRKIRTIGDAGRVFSPFPVPGRDAYLAIRVRSDLRHELIESDFQGTSSVLAIGDTFVSWHSPHTSGDGDVVVFSESSRQGSRLVSYDRKSGKLRFLTKWLPMTMDTPRIFQEVVYFRATWDGQPEIYAITPNSPDIHRVTFSRYAAYDPWVQDGWLYTRDFTTDGYRITRRALDRKTWVKVTNPEKRYDDPRARIAETALPAGQPADPGIWQGSVEPYPHLREAFRLHSWGILPTFNGREYAGTLQSDNLLSTTRLFAGYTYNQNENAGFTNAGMRYAGIFPVLQIQVGTGNRASFYTSDGGEARFYSWREDRALVGLELPLNFSRGYHTHTFLFSADAGITRVSEPDDPAVLLRAQGEHYPLLTKAEHLFTGPQAYRDFFPLYGHRMRFTDSQLLPGSGTSAFSRSLQSVLYLPGLFRSQSLVTENAVELSSDTVYRFAGTGVPARGYGFAFAPDNRKSSVNYIMGLSNTDGNAFDVIYLRRIYLNLFYDIQNLSGLVRSSVGMELMGEWAGFSLYWLNFQAGVRATHRIEAGQYVFEPVLLTSYIGTF